LRADLATEQALAAGSCVKHKAEIERLQLIAEGYKLEVKKCEAKEKEIERLNNDNERLQTEVADIKNATKAALDERCDLYERHCTCVPLLRRKVDLLRAAIDNWAVTPIGSHRSCDCLKCVRLVDLALEARDD
jgi:predicted RNase H-like nuclease (RuvC/YqgF family)